MPSLKYGEKYRIQNGYSNWGGGYLDVRGSGCQDNCLCVSTADSFDRDHGSGTWKILSATGKKIGEPVLANDLIYFQNQYGGDGGYLDVRGRGCQDNHLCVSTAKSNDRDHGSGTWRIMPDSSGGEVQEDEVVHLLNGYGGFQGGFLDVRGSGCQDNHLCVSTTLGWNRDAGSTHWRLHEQ